MGAVNVVTNQSASGAGATTDSGRTMAGPRFREAFSRSREIVLAAQERAQQAVERSSQILEVLRADREDLRATREEEQRRVRLLRIAAEESLRSVREKDKFLATVSHELRQPLNAALAALRLIEVGDTGSAARAVLHRQLAQMARLVDDLLDVSRLSLDVMELRLGHVELARVLADAVATIESELPSRELTLVQEESPPDMCVWGDDSRLRQVFSNLLVNAVRYTPPGGRITLLARVDRATVVVSVRDTGQGIAADDLSRIFDPFARGAEAKEGLGIGLALVRAIAELHRGSVVAESPGPGEGSTFTVTLPLCGHRGRSPGPVPDSLGSA